MKNALALLLLSALPKVFAKERVPITLDLGNGNARTVVLSSDLGHDDVSLNADYRS